MPGSTNPTAAPNKGQHSAGFSATDPKQIADTNATVNAFVKGARKPSWLTDSKPSSGPSPISKAKPHSNATRPQPTRPPVAPTTTTVAQPQPQPHPQPPPAVLPSPAPSDEPSPALSNVLNSPNITAGPLPVPSKETSPALEKVPDNVLDSANIPSGPLPDAPIMGPTTSLASNNLPVTDDRFVHDPTTREPNSAGPSGLGPGAGQKHAAPEPEPSAVQHTAAPSSINHVQLSRATESDMSAPGPSSMVDSRRGSAGPVAVRLTSKRQRVESIRSLRALVPVIRQHIQRTGGENGLSPDIDKPRMQLLMSACEQEDGFFIALHQLFAIWSHAPLEAYQILQLPSDIVDAGFSTMEQILKKNQFVSATHRQFFAEFPGYWTTQQQSQLDQNRAVLIATFLQKIVSDYDSLMRETWSRKYPYLVDELKNRLGCYSPVLQQIFFTANRRRLGVTDGPLGTQIESIFRTDQAASNTTDTARNEQHTASIIAVYRSIVHNKNQKENAAPTRAGSTNLQSPVSFGALQTPQATAAVPPQRQLASPTLPQQQSPFVPILPSPGYVVDLTAPGQLKMRYQPPHSPTPAGYTMVPSPHGNTPSQTFPVIAQYHQQQLQYPQGMQAQPLSPVLQQPQQFQVPTQRLSPVMQQQRQFLQPMRQQEQMAQQAHYLALQQQQQQQQQQIQQQQQKQQLQQLSHHQQMSFQRRINLDRIQAVNDIARQRRHPQNLGITTSGLDQGQANLTSPQLQQYASAQSPTPVTQGLQPQSTLNAQPPQFGLLHDSSRMNRRVHQAQVRGTSQAALQRLRGQSLEDPIIPPPHMVITRPDFPYDPYDKKAMMNGLHQSHIRSPKRVLKNGGIERVYQAVKSFPLPPTLLAPKNALQSFLFEVTEAQLALAAKSINSPGSLLPVVEHFNGMLRWRARCCTRRYKARSPTEPPTEQEWVTYDVSWPDHIFVRLNGRHLDLRKQPHNGKDLPVELTNYVVPGTNVLTVASPNTDPASTSTNIRFIAVELLESVSHSSIVDSVWKHGVIPADVTLQTIKKRLEKSADDDSFVIVAPHLPIDLACPFSAVIFEVPARGVGCTHLECFDLETWLNTRPSKPRTKCHHTQVQCGCPNTPEPSSPDKWRCPICHGDARPFSLRIDGFLLKVRSQLKDEGKLNTKRLLVEADGKWSVVLEEDDDLGSDEETPPTGLKGSPSLRRTASGAVVPARRSEAETIVID